MTILLDTHMIIWAITNDEQMNIKIKEMIKDTNNIILFSTASIWEIAIKNFKNPKACPYNEKYIYDKAIESGYMLLNIEPEHINKIRTLKVKPDKSLSNMDPFDRILIAQAKAKGIKIVSADENFKNYDEKCILQA